MDNETNSFSYKENNSAKKIKRFLPFIVIALVIVGVLVYLLNNRNSQSQVPKGATPLPKEVAVTLTDDGFNPPSVTIAKGSAVRWTNNASDEHVSVNSADHPTHKKFPELNLGEIPAGSTVVHIFNTSGTYMYHDHFHPERQGTVIVQ